MFRSFSLVAHGVRRCRVVAKAERGPRNTRPSHVFDLSVSRHTRLCHGRFDESGVEGIPGVAGAWKPRVSAWPRRTRGAEADFGLSRIPASRDIYFDVVISLANPATYPAAEARSGHVAERKARQKNSKHPVFDMSGHRQVPFDFAPLSFERHGRWAKQTCNVTKKLAFARAVALGLEPSEEIRRWYAVIACTIQKTNARILRGEPVPAASTSPPNRWLAGTRDLGLAGR